MFFGSKLSKYKMAIAYSLLYLVLCSTLALLTAVISGETNFTPRNWTQVADLIDVRCFHAMAPITDGTVLMYGGKTGINGGDFLNDASIYTPSSGGTWTPTTDGPTARSEHAMATLSDGKVLMYGGYCPNWGTDCGNDAYIFTLPSSMSSEIKGETGGTWTRVADGPSIRYEHAMASLGDGRVLMYGGSGGSGHPLNDASIYTPSSSSSSDGNGEAGGTWTPTTDGPSARKNHAMVPLARGKVLMYGGMTTTYQKSALNDAWIFQISSSTSGGNWTQITDGPSARSYHAMAPLPNGNGRVLIYGGWDWNEVICGGAWVYESSTWSGREGGTWTQVSDGPSTRIYHAMTPLSDGKVLMSGGSVGGRYAVENVWVYKSAAPDLCCHAKDPIHEANCATFLDPTSCDNYSKGFGDFCVWNC